MKTIIIALTMLTSVTAFAADKSPAKAAPVVEKAPIKDSKEHVADCRDGMQYWSTSTDHRGACSGHMGVLSWQDGTPVKGKGSKADYRR